MKRKLIPVLICLFTVTLLLAGCGGSNGGASPSPSSTASADVSASPSASAASSASPSASADASASPSAAPSPSPVPAPSPDGFVMGTVTSVDGNSITVSTVNPAGTKTITAENYTTFSVSGSTKTATISDIAVGDVITATLSGTSAIKIIDDGTGIAADPSAYISPSPSPSASPDASPSAS